MIRPMTGPMIRPMTGPLIHRMTGSMIRLARNTADAPPIVRHLSGCAFDPPLGTQLDLYTYAEKLLANAERFEAWADGELAGLVAAYTNRPPRAFVTNVSVLPQYSGRGIATRLLKQAIADCDQRGHAEIALEVRAGNPAANLYRLLGFIVHGTGATPGTIAMSRRLSG
jgi:ribosomal protein S18 acetylase RimI-like enzyme